MSDDAARNAGSSGVYGCYERKRGELMLTMITRDEAAAIIHRNYLPCALPVDWAWYIERADPVGVYEGLDDGCYVWFDYPHDGELTLLVGWPPEPEPQVVQMSLWGEAA